MIPLNPEKPGKAEGGDLEALCQKLEEKRGEKCGRNRDCNAGLKRRLIGEPPLITPRSRAAAGFDHDHPASSGNEIAFAAIRRRRVGNNAAMVIAK
ncbi:hypothetical protein G5I_03497 [Acromyrmex echinatior]|uniref:Uncharacterized protein n=1 Tax=Acromyrmex echinatior TaxID=103372 RepID=F4WD47_ACREC|nr:hypothetical protein G5I_03497 [Acromyrmex echinatior]